jgi:hypothetical protein
MKDLDAPGLVKLVVGVTTPAAAFYVIGYVVTQSYVISTRLQASFWFTERFYREAGARFLLDVLLSIALLPHVFIAFSALFILCFPEMPQPRQRQQAFGLSGVLARVRAIPPRNVIFAAVLLVALGGIAFILDDCGTSDCSWTTVHMPDWFFSNEWVFGSAETVWSDQYPLLRSTSLFLALTVPTVATLGVLSYRLITVRGEPEAGPGNARKPGRARPVPSKSHLLAAFLVVSSFVLLTAYIPIVYGTYFYDFVVVSLVDRSKCAVETSAAKPPAADGRRQFEPTQCYLLGRFDTRYILIGREIPANASEGQAMRETGQRIYIKQVNELEPFSIESTGGVPLRGLVPIRDVSY